MQKLLCPFIIVLSFQLAIGQNSTTKIDMITSNWDIPKEASFERFDNRETLILNGGRATVKNQTFANGTIEVDVYANSIRSFAGITFRKQDDTMEEVYMRLHKSNQVDAVQYTPIFNNESNWQLYREYQAKVSFKNTGWNTLRVEVANKKTEVFVNDEKVMTIDDLRTDHSYGEIGLFSLFKNRFSNFRFTSSDVLDDVQTDKTDTIDPAIIRQWEITKAIPYEGNLQFNDFLKEKYQIVTTEKSGLLPISKYLKKTSSGAFERNKEDYTIASTTIKADSNETRIFSFDYSDKIMLYLNGELIFKGNNAFRTKGIQYMGHMAINTNKLYLPLKKGENKIHCVIIDKANGWGLMAKLE
ncbi:MAG: family 16 glycoside hydrolase [Bacteroidota bacterium]